MQQKKEELENNISMMKSKINMKQKNQSNNGFGSDHESINWKRNYIFELVKQYIAMNKIVKRNEQCPAEEDEQKRLPFILIKFMPGSKANILQDPMKSNLVLDSTKMFDVMNENHLFEGMGITKVNSIDEYEKLFNPEIR